MTNKWPVLIALVTVFIMAATSLSYSGVSGLCENLTDTGLAGVAINVVKMPDNTFRAYYEGTSAGNIAMVSATSKDGVSWTKEQGVRYSAVGDSIEKFASNPWVFITTDNRYRMIYECKDTTDTDPNSSTGNRRLCSAISTDALNFTHEGLVMDGTSADINPQTGGYFLSVPSGIRDGNGSLKMAFVSDGSDIRTATSTDDGLHWTRDNGTALVFNSVDPALYKLKDGRYAIIYNDWSNPTVKSRQIGFSVSANGLAFTAESTPVVTMTGDYENSDPEVLIMPNGQLRLYFSAGSSAQLKTIYTCILPQHYYPHPARDFNGDGKSDILWQNSATGAVVAWLMNGAVTKSSGVVASSMDSAWQIKGFEDFNGDGKGDMLWQNSSTGAVVSWLMDKWLMDNATVVASSMDSAWQIKGVGDFNGDGKSDILWQNSATGAVVAWLMDNATIKSSGVVASSMDSAWQIKGVRDFDGDGKSDILWQNSATGAVYAWLMDNATIKSSGVVASSMDSAWQIKGLGDFDGDGSGDIIWQNSSTGAVVVWLINGTSVKSSGVVVSSMDSAWQIKTVGDFDGDGYSDIIWQNSSTGAVYAWLMSGTAIKSSNPVSASVDSVWQMK
ncbi:MAG: VCBS repeat-containing protein [Nitrospirae bacterium]|nr:VCBS repeat-containing protein [Nitrospirota bacterium]